MKRIIVIGDIHGCIDEVRDLSDRLAVTSSDRLISVGDIICKGPDSAQCLDWAMSMPNLECILGNHELRFLNSWKNGRKPNIKPYDMQTVRNMGSRFETYMKFIENWPLYIDLEELTVIHAGLRPGISLKKQSPLDLTQLRGVEPDDAPWYEYYEGGKKVIFGHWVRRNPLVQEKIVGIDTGCVYGGKLTAFIWPDDRVISVKARKAYRLRSNSWN